MPPAIANTATPRCSPSSSAMAEGGFQGESLGPRHLMSSRGCRRSSPQAIRREPSCSLTPWPGKRFGPGEKSARSARGGKTGAPADAKPVMCPAAQLRHIALLDPPEAEEAGRRIDVDAAQRAAGDLLVALGADLTDKGLRGTPRRMAAAYAELLTSQPFRPTTFPNDEGYDELVLVRSIPFHSLCMHHLLPFHGVAHIGYLPGERILGLSKFARVVELFARDLQVQERLTVQVADWLQQHLAPKGVGVVLEAEHLCMSLRGVQKFGARTVTSALHGLVRDDPRTRQEFLALTTRSDS